MAGPLEAGKLIVLVALLQRWNFNIFKGCELRGGLC
jgi:hypothetical protein